MQETEVTPFHIWEQKDLVCENTDQAYDMKDQMKNFVMIPQNKGVMASICDLDEKVCVFESGNTPDLKDFYGKGGYNTHIAFEYWACLGAVYGKLGKMWYKCGKDMKSMPDLVYVGFDEIFETMFPEYRWQDENESCRKRWRSQFEKVFDFLNGHGLAFRRNMKNVFKKSEDVYWDRILENDIVYRVSKKGVKSAIGLKVRVKGNGLWEFTCGNERGVLRAVQIRPYELYLKRFFRKGGYNHGIQKIYLVWNMLYKNYWMKKHYWKGRLEISTKEMRYAFAGGVMKHSRLCNEDMERMLMSFESNEGRRPAHINNLRKCGAGCWFWDIFDRYEWNDVISKDKYGNYQNISEKEMTDEMKQDRRYMNMINRVNGKHGVYLDNEKIQTNMSVIYRRDGKDICDGRYGRNYSFGNGFQNVKSADRLRMLIDGEKVNEVDFSGLHIRMLYALEGKEYNKGDIYDLGDWYVKYGLDEKTQRFAVKKMILIMVNAPCRSKAWFAFKKEWNEWNGTHGYHRIEWMDELIDLIECKHKDIAKYFCSGKGVELQWMDGKLMRDICYHFSMKDICALPIHDSLVIQERYVNEAIEVMETEYGKMFGNRKCPIKVKKS